MRVVEVDPIKETQGLAAVKVRFYNWAAVDEFEEDVKPLPPKPELKK